MQISNDICKRSLKIKKEILHFNFIKNFNFILIFCKREIRLFPFKLLNTDVSLKVHFFAINA